MIEPASHVRPDDAHLWTTPDPESLEDEVASLLIGFVRAMKPEVVVEIGSYTGIVSHEIGRALKLNGRGHLHTFEIDPSFAARARDRCADLPVTVHLTSSTTIDVGKFAPVDLLLIDGALDQRAPDFERWRPVMATNAVALVHDSLKYDPPKSAIRALADTEQVWLRTPRGLTIVQPNPEQFDVL